MVTMLTSAYTWEKVIQLRYMSVNTLDSFTLVCVTVFN